MSWLPAGRIPLVVGRETRGEVFLDNPLARQIVPVIVIYYVRTYHQAHNYSGDHAALESLSVNKYES